jgi:hypothetical protein
LEELLVSELIYKKPSQNQLIAYSSIKVLEVCLLTFGFFHNVFRFSINAQKSPYPPSLSIKSIDFEWSSHIRLASASDNWSITCADDDHQSTVWGDGGGFGGTNTTLGDQLLEYPELLTSGTTFHRRMYREDISLKIHIAR